MLASIDETFIATASKLAPALGIIGGIMSTIIGDQTPTAEDILELTNNALAKLTEEIDHRIDEMKDYVDLEIVKLIKDINHRKYKFLYAYWSGCINGPKSESDLCQREANRLIQASINEFAMYSDQMNKDGVFQPALTDTQKKKLEVNLVLFRNYVFLSLMATKAVAETYEGNAGLSKLFNDQLKKNANFFEKYADSAVKEIINLNSDFGVEELESSYRNKGSDVNEAHLKFKEFKRACEAVLSPLLPTSRKCHAEVITLFASPSWESRREGHFYQSWKHWKSDYTSGVRVYDNNNILINNGRTGITQNVADGYCKQVLLEKQSEYKTKIGEEVTKYWEEEVQQVVKCGKKLVEAAATAATTCD